MENGEIVEGKITAEVKIENAVIEASVKIKIDIIEELRKLAKQTDNTIDDALVEMIALGRDNLDWKGHAKKIL